MLVSYVNMATKGVKFIQHVDKMSTRELKEKTSPNTQASIIHIIEPNDSGGPNQNDGNTNHKESRLRIIVQHSRIVPEYI